MIGRATVACALLIGAILTSPAYAGPHSQTTAAVSMGDSFITGESGRWAGNSNDWQDPTVDGTDRSAHEVNGNWIHDLDSVYPNSWRNHCDRSDVAEIKSAHLDVSKTFNIACAGATTRNLLRDRSGGVGSHGEPSQAEQLSKIAKANRVRLIIISIGGNDIGFTQMMVDCITSFMTNSVDDPNYCSDVEQPGMRERIDNAAKGVARDIDEVRAVMSDAGYKQADYRLAIQSYPSPVPRSADNRYPQYNWSRVEVGGCPFWDVDLDWAHNWLVPNIADSIEKVANHKRVEYLDLHNAFDKREVCSNSTALVSETEPPSSAKNEWVRFVTFGVTQGQTAESLHPNALGQVALGRCLSLLYSSKPGSYSCQNEAGKSADFMSLSPLGD